MSFIKNDGKSLIVAMDHGLTMGALEGIENMEKTLISTLAGKPDGILISTGTAKKFKSLLSSSKIPIILRCDYYTGLVTPSVKPPEQEEYTILTNVNEAVRLGASSVMLFLIFGNQNSKSFIKNVKLINKVSTECRKLKVPLFVETVLWGRSFSIDQQNDYKSLKNACRIAAELGADYIKAPYTGNFDTFKEVVYSTFSPIFILGGAKINTLEELFKMIKDSLDAGGKGVVFGRNIWQYTYPKNLIIAISKLIHKNISIEEAAKVTINSP
jgi:DhnA family fructose-bisphosphate aldolase class Ia